MEFIDNIKGKVFKPQKETFILVKEGDLGIQTYVNPLIRQMNHAYKLQLKSFLEGLIKELNVKELKVKK